MTAVVVHHLWQQKHPTPSRADWDFHWHPLDIAPEVAQAISTAEIIRAGAGATGWSIRPESVAWVRTFAAVAPSEQRRYVGLAGTIARPAATVGRSEWSAVLPNVLAAIALPPAVPFADGGSGPTTQTIHVLPSPATVPPVQSTSQRAMLTSDAARALARAVWFGGAAPLPTAAVAPDDQLPSLFGRMLTWLPAAIRTRPRHGMFVPNGAPSPRPPSPAARNLIHYLARCWTPPELSATDRELPTLAWRLVLDLSHSLRIPVEDVFAELTRVATSWDTADNLRDYLVSGEVISPAELGRASMRAPMPLFTGRDDDAGWLWTRVLHYWGRGLLGGDRVLTQRLVRTLACRITVDHLFRLDAPTGDAHPRRYLGRLQYEAILPRPAVDAMLAGLRRTIPALFGTPAR